MGKFEIIVPGVILAVLAVATMATDGKPPPTQSSYTTPMPARTVIRPEPMGDRKPMDVLIKPFTSEIGVLNRPLIAACNYTDRGCSE